MLVKSLLLLNWITSCTVGVFIVIDIISSIKIYSQRKELIRELKKYHDRAHLLDFTRNYRELKLKPKISYNPSENILPFKNPAKNNDR